MARPKTVPVAVVLARAALMPWVMTCRANAEVINRTDGYRVQFKPPFGDWQDMCSNYDYKPRTLFRVAKEQK
jgi:hypothetical protein